MGGSFGAGVLAVVLAQGISKHVGDRSLAFHTAFWWSIGLTALALLPARFLPSGAAVKAESDDTLPTPSTAA